MAIFEVTEENLGKLLLPGVMSTIHQGLKQRIMEQLEKEVDGVLEDVLNRVAGTIDSYRSFADNQVNIVMNINGVPFK